MAILSTVVLVVVAAILYAVIFVGRRGRDLPPGPPTLPVIGNLHQIPKKGAHLQFTKWAKQYGGMYSLKIGTGTAVVLTDRRLIKELLDKKSSKYSNRPPSFISHDLMTKGDHLLVMQYGNLWRSFRKITHQHFMESVVEKNYVPLQEAEAVQMMRDFLISPEKHMFHPKRYSNSIIMSLLFGIRTPTIDAKHMTKLYDMMENWSKIMEPGNTPPVDIFPFLYWIPERLFGNWISRASNVGDEMNDLYANMLDRVQKRREVHGSRGSIMDDILDQNDKLGLNRHELYFLGGVLMEGGSDTSSSIIIAFTHAMTKWPDVARKAQKEIDAVMGEERSPLWSDYAKLPYVAQVVKEAMRWRPVAPLCFPHALAEDDWVDGKLLPKGTILFINAWGLHHDENRFPNPDRFDPDHYAGQTTLAPELAISADYASRDHYAYGAGRRICPGIHLAERNLFLGIAKLLWAFDFKAGTDANAEVIEPDTDPETGYSEGFLVCARPFACSITARSETRRQTILTEFERAETEIFSKFEA